RTGPLPQRATPLVARSTSGAARTFRPRWFHGTTAPPVQAQVFAHLRRNLMAARVRQRIADCVATITTASASTASRQRRRRLARGESFGYYRLVKVGVGRSVRMTMIAASPHDVLHMRESAEQDPVLAAIREARSRPRRLPADVRARLIELDA